MDLLVGASAGIGAETARLFAKHGAKLVLTGRDRERLRAVGEECKQLGLREDEVSLVGSSGRINEV